MFFNSGGFIMLKDEWLEYFEAVNGRKPRPIDFKEALERGEFVLSEGTEANHCLLYTSSKMIFQYG